MALKSSGSSSSSSTKNKKRASSNKNVVILKEEKSLLNSSFPFEEEEETNDNEEEEEDIAILNMSIIKSILGQSSKTNLLEDDNDENEEKGTSIRKETMNNNNNTKAVSFATGISSVGSSDSDINNKTYDQLISKVGKLQATLQQTKCDLSGEKAIRRKKEKNLIKLAKELTKRSKKDEERNTNIEEMKATIINLKSKLATARDELHDCRTQSEQKTRVAQNQFEEAQEKYRTVCLQHDDFVAELKRTHRVALDDLRRQHTTQMEAVRNDLLTKRLECDTLHAELARHLIQDAPIQDADAIARRTIERASIISSSSSTKSSGVLSKKKKNMMKMMMKPMVLLQLAGFVTLAWIVFAYGFGLQSMNSICSPIKPGSTLSTTVSNNNNNNASFEYHEAPWWAPKNYKPMVFTTICKNRPRTALTWDGKLLSITNLVEKEEKVALLFQQRAIHTRIDADSIHLYDKKQKVTSFQTPWSSSSSKK